MRIIALLSLGLMLFLGGMPRISAAEEPAPPAVDFLLRTIGTTRGLCGLLGGKAGDVALELARRSELMIYVQVPDAPEALRVRKEAHAAGLLGSRIFVSNGNTNRIHLADNLADALIDLGPAAVPEQELFRVLRPGGKAVRGKTVTTRPPVAGTEAWSHPYHGPDNNPLSNDQVARAPYLTQFLATPYYCAMPQISVAAGGRLFKAYGHIAFRPREWKTLNKLMASNAYNGTLLWERDLTPGFMIHRSTFVATPEVLYLGDDKSCKIIDAASGKIRGEIVIGPRTAEGPVWKWMALADGVLYALVGTEKASEPVIRKRRNQHGWGWGALGKGYDKRRTYAWGFGRTLLAIDPDTRKVLWSYKSKYPIDSRAVCLKSRRLYFYCHQKMLACLNTGDGSLRWKSTDPKLLAAIGDHHPAQRFLRGWSSSAYMKCSDRALFFAGPQRSQLVAASTEDGRLLWQYPEGNFQLVVRKDALYALGSNKKSHRFDILTGRDLPHKMLRRRNCTRITGSVDSIFTRGAATSRYDLAATRWETIAPVRPGCNDGVMISNGLLYIGPWMCDCNISLLGILCLGPAGDFKFNRSARRADRLETQAANRIPATTPAIAPSDWPTYRKDNQRSAGTSVAISTQATLRWQFTTKTQCLPTAAVTAGKRAFLSGTDGIVRAFDIDSGKPVWTAYTGGAVMFAPTLWKGRVFVGSGDGWVYCFAARNGALLWRFRAAPAERMIPTYGRLSSTWPVASGVLVANGVAYAAAGIANYDGTHVYALDARTGHIRWQNNTSGGSNGVAVQGHLLLHRNVLYLAGGNRRSPGAYDVRTGKSVKFSRERMKWPWRTGGKELFLYGDRVRASQHLLYGPEEDFLWAAKPRNQYAGYRLRASNDKAVIFQGPRIQVTCGSPTVRPGSSPKKLWQKKHFAKNYAMAVAGNAAVVTGRHTTQPGAAPSYALAVFDLADGRLLQEHRLPGCPVQWGIAIDRAGRMIISLRNGTVLCIG